MTQKLYLIALSTSGFYNPSSPLFGDEYKILVEAVWYECLI